MPDIIKAGALVCKIIVYGFVAALVVLSMQGNARAQAIGVHIATWHDSGKWNDFNPGVYVRTWQGITAGIYRNSLRKPSMHAGYSWSKAHALGDVSLTAGVVTGYAQTLGPLLVPSVRLGNLRLTLLPKSDPKGVTGLHFSTEF